MSQKKERMLNQSTAQSLGKTEPESNMINQTSNQPNIQQQMPQPKNIENNNDEEGQKNTESNYYL